MMARKERDVLVRERRERQAKWEAANYAMEHPVQLGKPVRLDCGHSIVLMPAGLSDAILAHKEAFGE